MREGFRNTGWIRDDPMTPLRVSNAMFLRLCVYFDDWQEWYWDGLRFYDRQTVEQDESEVKEKICRDGDNVLREVRDDFQPLFRAQTEAQVHNE